MKAIRVGLFALMYLGLWALTGVPIYFASVVLSAVGAGVLAYVVAGVLVSAGIFQLSPLKQVCLRHCRSPLGFLFGHWREGWQGGLAMGRAHALYCLGCCWALMLVFVAAGAMGLVWAALITRPSGECLFLPCQDRERARASADTCSGGRIAQHGRMGHALWRKEEQGI